MGGPANYSPAPGKGCVVEFYHITTQSDIVWLGSSHHSAQTTRKNHARLVLSDSPVNVNCCITREWRTLPERYQGLGLPEWGGDCLAAKIFLIQRLWGFESASATLVSHAYEAFQMEVGLFGNILAQDYNQYGCLATNGTWFANLWEYLKNMG